MGEDDFLEIGQDNDDLGIDLTAGMDDIEFVDVRDQPEFEYPAMLISGLKFNDALRVLQSVRMQSYRLFDVWVDLEDGTPPVKQGSLPANSTTLLAMRYLCLRVTLYLNEDSVETLDLRDAEVIENFI